MAVSRRELLKGAAAGLFLSPMMATFLSGAEKCARPFRFGVCDWSIGRQQDVEALALASQVGLDGVEVSFDGGPKNDLRDAEVRQKYTDAAKRYNVEICSLAIGILNKVPFASDPRAVEWVGDSIGVLQQLHVDMILVPFFVDGEIIGDVKRQDAVIANLKKLAPRAERAGVRLALETSLSADDDMRLLDGVGSPAVKIYYDVSNKLRRGYDIYKDIPRLGCQRICRFHMKEKENKLLGQGIVDFARVRDLIGEIGYRDWLVMEAATVEGRSEVECHKDNLKYLRSLFCRDAATGQHRRWEGSPA